MKTTFQGCGNARLGEASILSYRDQSVTDEGHNSAPAQVTASDTSRRCTGCMRVFSVLQRDPARLGVGAAVEQEQHVHLRRRVVGRRRALRRWGEGEGSERGQALRRWCLRRHAGKPCGAGMRASSAARGCAKAGPAPVGGARVRGQSGGRLVAPAQSPISPSAQHQVCRSSCTRRWGPPYRSPLNRAKP